MRSVLLLLSLAATGCSSLPEHQYSDAADDALGATTGWEYAQTGAQYVNTLNELIDDPQLDRLIAVALLNNPGLRETTLALKIAYADADVAQADRLPSVSVGTGISRAEGNPNIYSSELEISWELDLWGKLSDGVSASKLDIKGSEAAWESARAALSANVMRRWLEVILHRQLITIETQRVTVLENNEGLITRRYRAGLGSLEELDDARSSSASARATLAEYRENLAAAQRSLRQLLGWQGREEALPETAEFPMVLEALSAFPDQNLAARPDLQQAYFAIQSAYYNTRVAYKDLLPSISLSAALSDSAGSLSDALFTSPAWNLLGQLTAPLFTGGRLQAQAEMAEYDEELAWLSYQETLLTAVTEVNNTLGLEASLQQQQSHLQKALASATRSSASYEERYRQGLVDILDLLTIQQKTFDLQTQLTQITYSRLTNRIDLGLALGLRVPS